MIDVELWIEEHVPSNFEPQHQEWAAQRIREAAKSLPERKKIAVEIAAAAELDLLLDESCWEIFSKAFLSGFMTSLQIGLYGHINPPFTTIDEPDDDQGEFGLGGDWWKKT